MQMTSSPQLGGDIIVEVPSIYTQQSSELTVISFQFNSVRHCECADTIAKGPFHGQQKNMRELTN